MAIGTITTDPMASTSTTAPTGAGTITLLAETGTGATATFLPGATTIISGGTTTTESFPCGQCCYSGVWLPAFFGPSGICPGDIDNSVPVTLTATWNFTPISGITLSDYCLSSSGSFSVIADNTTITNWTSVLRVASPVTCGNISAPTSVLQSSTVPPSLTASNGSSILLTGQVPITLCGCSASNLNFYSPYGGVFMYRSSYSCNPFSITYKNWVPSYIQSGFLNISGQFTLTLTE